MTPLRDEVDRSECTVPARTRGVAPSWLAIEEHPLRPRALADLAKLLGTAMRAEDTLPERERRALRAAEGTVMDVPPPVAGSMVGSGS